MSVTLDRIDKKAVEYGFSGTMRGANENVTIHQDTALRQQRQGVFCCIAGATIENLKITGTVERGTYVGGIAYYVMGTGDRKSVV